MVQRSGSAGLLFEPLEPLGVGGECRGQNFDGDVAAEPRVAGAIDLAHAAGAKQADDFIRAEARSGSERHVIELRERQSERRQVGA